MKNEWHIQAFEDGEWKPWCRCFKEPMKIYNGGEPHDLVFCTTPAMSGEDYLRTRCLHRWGIKARIVNTRCPSLDE